MGTCRRLVDALPTSKPRREIPGGVFLCSLVNLSVGLPGNRSPDRRQSTVFIPSRTISTSAARRRLPVLMSPGPTSGVSRTDIRRLPDRHPAARCFPRVPRISGQFDSIPWHGRPPTARGPLGRPAGARAMFLTNIPIKNDMVYYYKVLIAYK